MMATGPWQDTVYSACCFMGARCQAQRLRHNIDEIAQWPALHCHPRSRRVAALPSGWSACVPLQGGGGIHRLAGFWNCSVRFLVVGRPPGAGEAPRPPFPLCGNRGREHWLQIDPRALREWAMAPTAIALGLRPTHPEERARTPHRSMSSISCSTWRGTFRS